MPQFKVTLTRTIWATQLQTAYVTVEADTEEEAITMADDIVTDADYDGDLEGDEVDSDVSVEEIEDDD